MHVLGTRLALAAGLLATAGLSGCSLPHVLPVVATTTQGPSPYGVWYEQHWATNSVLLAAADQPESGEIEIADDAAVEDQIRLEQEISSESPEAQADGLGAAPGEDAAAAAEASADAAVEAANAMEAQQKAQDFDNSTPYQFPASSFTPPPADEGYVAPGSNEPIRY